MHLNKFEKIIIILILVVGLLGGVVLVYLKAPPIISSVFIAMGIATLVFHFLGGIEIAQVNTGVVKLGGSMAALIGSAILINNLLALQVINPEEKFHINSKYEIFNSHNKRFGKMFLNNFQLKLNNNLNVIAEDSIRMGTLDFGYIKLYENYEVKGNDSIKIGKLKESDLIEFGLLKKLELKNYTEIKFNTRLASPLKYEVDESLWNGVNEYRANYYLLPFKILPTGSADNNFRTKVIFEGEDFSEDYYPLRSRETILIPVINNNEKLIYLIRVRQLEESKKWNSFNNFVQYQIIEFSGTLE